MSRTVYVNGEYLPENDAKISVFDRGFLFLMGFMKYPLLFVENCWTMNGILND